MLRRLLNLSILNKMEFTKFKKVLEPPAESQRNPRIKDSPRHYYYLTAEFALIPYF